MLEIEGLNVFYDEIQVLRDVGFTAKAGQLVAIFGPNGHGKTTLLKTLCGLVRPSSGVVRLEGVEIQGTPAERLVPAGVVLVPEDRHLFPEMTVLENLRLGAYCRAARETEASNLELVFDLFPKLQDMQRREAGKLSGGEARMLALGRGLMSNPRLLAIDEPSFGLLPRLRTEVFDLLRHLADRGLCILVVEQSTARITELADEIHLLEDGRIVFSGSSAEALENEEFKRVYLGLALGGSA